MAQTFLQDLLRDAAWQVRDSGRTLFGALLNTLYIEPIAAVKQLGLHEQLDIACERLAFDRDPLRVAQVVRDADQVRRRSEVKYRDQ